MADEMNRVIAGKEAFSTADTKTKGGNPVNTWEAMLNDGCTDPYTTTVVALKARNGRGGTQAGV